MARTNLTVTRVDGGGVASPAKVAGTVDGHMFGNSGKTFLEVANGNAAARVLTIVTPGSVGGQSISDRTVTVPGSATNFKIGDLNTNLFNRRSTDTDPGKVYINFPAGQEADLSVAAYRL